MTGQELDFLQMAFTAEALNNQGKHREVISLLQPLAEHPDNLSTSFFNELGMAYGLIGSKTNDSSYFEEAYRYHQRAYILISWKPMYILNLAMAASRSNKLEEALYLFNEYVASGHKRGRKLALDEVRKLESPIMEHRMQLAQAFIEQYNTVMDVNYSFECIRRSMFQVPKYRVPGLYIYEMTFTKKRGLLAFLNRYIVEVATLNVNEQTWESTFLDLPLQRSVKIMEDRAKTEVVCSKHLLIDLTRLESLDEKEAYTYQQFTQVRGSPYSLWFEQIYFAYRDNLGKVVVIK